MTKVPRLEELGRLVGDRSRTAMLSALMDGRAWTGRELAESANVTAPTASTHLQRLVHGGLISVVPQGRHCYYRIASRNVAAALESLLLLAPASAPRHPTQRRIAADLAEARLCYDHLAGRLGVTLTDALVSMGALTFDDSTASLTDDGHALFLRLGIGTLNGVRRKPLCRPCIDWSERRLHVAGTVGAALASAALDRGWLNRKKETRAVVVTAAGARALREHFGIEWAKIAV
jgi:DNA-binding transcriptional ArsR family regulator